MVKDTYDHNEYWEQVKEELRHQVMSDRTGDRMVRIKFLIMCEVDSYPNGHYNWIDLVEAVVRKNNGTRPTHDETRQALHELMTGVY